MHCGIEATILNVTVLSCTLHGGHFRAKRMEGEGRCLFELSVNDLGGMGYGFCPERKGAEPLGNNCCQGRNKCQVESGMRAQKKGQLCSSKKLL